MDWCCFCLVYNGKELMFCVRSTLYENFTCGYLARVDQSNCHFVGRDLIDERGDIFWHARQTLTRVKVAQSGKQGRSPVSRMQASLHKLIQGIDAGGIIFHRIVR